MRTHKCQLLFDSARAQAHAGSRGGIGAERSLVFQSGEYTVDLVVHDGAECVRYVHGQVARDGHDAPTCASVSLHGAPDTVPTDELGQFAVSGATTLGAASIAIAIGEDVLICTIPPREEAEPVVA